MNDFPTQGRLAGIDFGTVRIGVAVCDADRRVASPFDVYTRRGRDADARYFRALVREESIVAFVVGLPLHTSGQESRKSRESRDFARWLATVTGCPVRLHDERFTTREAHSLLGESQLTTRQRRARLDKLAAQLLLAAYLESDRPEDEPGSLDLDDQCREGEATDPEG